jgi:hypothetical protein
MRRQDKASRRTALLPTTMRRCRRSTFVNFADCIPLGLRSSVTGRIQLWSADKTAVINSFCGAVLIHTSGVEMRATFALTTIQSSIAHNGFRFGAVWNTLLAW